MSRTTRLPTRRTFLHGGLVASLALVASLGALPLPEVAADKKAGAGALQLRIERCAASATSNDLTL